MEREAKLTPPDDFVIPDLDGVVNGVTTTALPPLVLDAIYFDTTDFALARAGVTLRHRTGEPGPEWTLKLPEFGASKLLSRREIEFEDPPGRVPVAAIDLVQAIVRARSVDPVAHLRTTRSPLEVFGADGRRVATIVDDRVAVTRDNGSVDEFREVEVEMRDDGKAAGRIIRAIITRLTQAGATAEAPMPKLVRALGPRAQDPPDVVVTDLPDAPTVADVVCLAVSGSVAQMLHHDCALRLGGDPEDVHQLRVATRRLRSDLRTFRDVLDRDRVEPVRAELKWLGERVGAVRDNDVLRESLTSACLALPELDKAEAALLLGRLAEEGEAARTELLAALRDRRYLALLDALVDLVRSPPSLADAVANRTKKRGNPGAPFVREPWRHLADAVAALGAEPADADLHQIRIKAKRCRYAAEAVVPIAGPAARRLAVAVENVQTVLGEHQDTVVAEAWLRGAAAFVPAAGIVVGQLVAAERMRRRDLRRRWPKVWKKADTSKLRRWL